MREDTFKSDPNDLQIGFGFFSLSEHCQFLFSPFFFFFPYLAWWSSQESLLTCSPLPSPLPPPGGGGYKGLMPRPYIIQGLSRHDTAITHRAGRRRRCCKEGGKHNMPSPGLLRNLLVSDRTYPPPLACSSFSICSTLTRWYST